MPDVVAPDVAYWGLPGTGKTTTLMEVVKKEIDAGVPPTAIAGVTFRRAMAEEFKQRAQRVIGEGIGQDHWFRTTHSACYRLLELDKEDVVQDNHRREVCEQIGLDYSSGASVADVVDSGGGAFTGGRQLGDELFEMYSHMRNTLRDPRKHWREHSYSVDRHRLSQNAVETFIDAYEEYKREEGLYDFDDMLEGAIEQGLTPSHRVLIEDEFQDKTPLQVEVYNTWAEQCSRVYVAGDEFQSLYSWRGTDPEFMRRAIDGADESEVLDRSYRFGRGVWDPAEAILEQAGYDVPQISTANSSQSQAIGMNDYRKAVEEHKYDDCLHLVRANFLADDVVEALTDVGVPFTSLGGSSYRWTDKMIDLYNGVSALATAAETMFESFGHTDVEFQSLSEFRRVAEALPAGELRCQKKDAKQAIEDAETLGDVDIWDVLDQQTLPEIKDANDPFSMLNKSAVRNSHDRLTNAWRSLDGARMGSIDHRISSIHGAKGSEASTVFLLDGSTRKIESSDNNREESRVWFVGATRASDNLYWVRTNQQFTRGMPPEVAQ